MSMTALSLDQPWASLVANGDKLVETRSWSTANRGWLAIHVTQTFPTTYQNLCATEPFHRCLSRITGKTEHKHILEALPCRAIIALAELVDILPVDSDDLFLDSQDRAFGDFSPGRYAWVLGRVIRLREPVSWPGLMRLWTVPEHVVVRVWAQLTAHERAIIEVEA